MSRRTNRKQSTKKLTEIVLDWNMYHEGIKMIGLQDENFKQFEGLRTTRVNHSIWRINKELDKVLVQKVYI